MSGLPPPTLADCSRCAHFLPDPDASYPRGRCTRAGGPDGFRTALPIGDQSPRPVSAFFPLVSEGFTCNAWREAEEPVPRETSTGAGDGSAPTQEEIPWPKS